MIKNNNIKLLVDKYNENKLSHVFLVETNDKKQVLNDILQLIKVINCSETYNEECTKCNLCHLIDTNNLPSLSVIYPDGQAIKKSQMEELKLLFANKPYLSKYNTYIINDAEKFNSSSANTMLKFIEEPEDKLIGFLITNNKENVITTIKSRCEIVKAYYDIEENIDDPILLELAINYVKKTEASNNESIIINKELVDQKLDRAQMQLLFKLILEFYLDLLNGKEFKYEELKVLEKLSLEERIKRIKLINDIIDKLNYNVNIQLLLDYYVLSLED